MRIGFQLAGAPEKYFVMLSLSETRPFFHQHHDRRGDELLADGARLEERLGFYRYAQLDVREAVAFGQKNVPAAVDADGDSRNVRRAPSRPSRSYRSMRSGHRSAAHAFAARARPPPQMRERLRVRRQVERSYGLHFGSKHCRTNPPISAWIVYRGRRIITDGFQPKIGENRGTDLRRACASYEVALVLRLRSARRTSGPSTPLPSRRSARMTPGVYGYPSTDSDATRSQAGQCRADRVL